MGCAFAPSIVLGDVGFGSNPDSGHPVYSGALGLYSEHCGLSQVKMSWGHDEYLYRVLQANQCTLPTQAMYMIRFHSFYAWHHARDYKHLVR